MERSLQVSTMICLITLKLWESRVFKFHFQSKQGVLGRGDVKEMQVNRNMTSKHLSLCNHRCEGVADLSCKVDA